MYLSAEIRWFWRTEMPADVWSWFCSANSDQCAAGGGGVRLDEYLIDLTQAQLGIKRRGGQAGAEVKGLVTTLGPDLDANPLVGPIEIWAKWNSSSLRLDGNDTIAIEKRRWLRQFDTAHSTPREIELNIAERAPDGPGQLERGCTVEMTLLGLPTGAKWWTFGFESFGALETVEPDLRTVTRMWARRKPPLLPELSLLASYPAWLRTCFPHMPEK